MPEPEGGIRDRLIWESVTRWLKTGLQALNWFGPLGIPSGTGGPKIEVPSITWRTERIADYAKIPANTLAISSADTDWDPLEIGSYGATDTTMIWVEFFASDDATGRMVIGDVFDMVRGLMPSIGYDSPHVPVLDYRLDPVPAEPLFTVELEDAHKVHGGQNPARPEMRHWFGVSFDIADEKT